MNNTLEQLISVKNKIATPDKFIQGWYCADERGIHTDLGNVKACKFCIKGAVYTTTPVTGYARALHALEIVAAELYPQPEPATIEAFLDFGKSSAIVYVNDELGFDAVHRVLDETILRVKDGWTP